MILPVLRKFYYFWLSFVSFLRYFRFKVSVWFNRGHLSTGHRVNFRHRVVFQGRGLLEIRDNVTFGFELAGAINDPIILQPRNRNAVITINSGTSIMNGCEVIACDQVSIGANCLIGPRTIFMDSDFHGLEPQQRKSGGKTVPIIIEENVWVGSRCLILKGVTIGQDAVVAAGAIVTRSVNAGEIVAGSPAKVIGSVYQKDTNV